MFYYCYLITFCSIFVLSWNTANSMNNFVIAKQEDEIACVTNRSEALALFNPINHDVFNGVSVYVQNNNNFFDCGIGEFFDNSCQLEWIKTPWILKTSLNEDFLLDRRWEAFREYRTENVMNGENFKYQYVTEIDSQDFEIHLSIRIRVEAHLFLCDGLHPNGSNCYWFMLGAWQGQRTALRKCKKSEIPTIDGVNIKSISCRTSLVEKMHSINYPRFLSAREWRHFKLRKKSNEFSFSFANISQNDEKIISFTDEIPFQNVRHLILHSKAGNGFWKVHQYNYIKTTEITQQKLGPSFQIVNNFYCISLFVSMCNFCKLKLELINDADIPLATLIQEPHQTSGWTEIKFSGRIYDTLIWVNLLVSTIITEKSFRDKPYWAIDHVGLCQEHGYRVVKSKENPNLICQLMTNEHGSITLKYPTDYIGNNCPTNTFGKKCLDCKWIFGGCKKIKVCERESTGTVICSCAAGYMGEDCQEHCPGNIYGFGCKMLCGKCFGSCDAIDGKCPGYSCKEGFNGNRCDIPPAAIFDQPPEIEAVSHTSATVRLFNFTIIGAYGSHLQRYQVEFKKDDDPKNNWQVYPDIYPIGYNNSTRIQHLSPNTNYLVRAVILNSTDTDRYTYDDHYVRFTLFKTTCEAIKENDITTSVTNNSISIIDIKTSNITCQTNNSDFKINGYSATKKQSTYIFSDLNAATNYTLLLRNNSHFKKVIRTLDGKATKVRNLYFFSINATSLKINWTEPEHKNGVIKNYIIKYEHNKYKECVSNSSSKINLRNVSSSATDMETFINNLIPYSQYIFTIYAENSINGDPSRKLQSTEASHIITEEEIPAVTIDPRPFSIQVNLSSIDCKLIRGPLLIQLCLKCTNKWCRNDSSTYNHKYDRLLNVTGLLSFSDYIMNMQVCRGRNIDCVTNSKNFTFKTKPAEPKKVINLIPYSKGNNYISIRWEPPYPPTGILEEFRVNYSFDEMKTKTLNIHINNSYCKLWPEYHCLTLQNLEPEKLYQIQVLARNMDPTDRFGQKESTNAITIIDTPEAPYDLKIISNDESDLELSWKHPNVTNGNLTKFYLYFKSPYKNTSEVSIPIVEEASTYFHSINTLMPSTLYEIYVKAFNGIKSHKSSSVTYTSPPPIPILVEDPQYSSSNVSISIKIPSLKETSQSNFVAVLVFISSQELEKYPKSDILTTYRINIPNITHNFRESYSKQYVSVQKDIEKSPIVIEHLNSGTEYEIAVVLVSKFGNKTRHKIYQKKTCTLGGQCKMIGYTEETSNNSLWALLLLLLLIPILIFAFLKRKTISSKFRSLRRINVDRSREIDVGESMPLATNPNITTSDGKNLPPKKNIKHSKRVKIAEFEQYVRKSLATGELQRQHELFPRGLIKSCKYGELAANKSKNRYKNLIAYDHTRVVLEKIPGKEHSDYINANYVDGYQVPQAYIATQGPKATTVSDFWRMIWQENVMHIVMLANVYENKKKKVEKYWPEINERLEYDNITIQHVSSSVFNDYEHNVFKVNKNGIFREINQLHFTSWPDHGVPLYCQSLVPFLQTMLSIPLKSKSPIVVHCSAGVGRTGTVILCDFALRMAAKEGAVDILNILQNIRNQRPNLVDNIEQYKVAHLVILECLLGMQTAIPCREIRESIQNWLTNNTIKLQMQYLKDTVWKDQAMKTVKVTDEKSLPVYDEKNRFPSIIPEIEGRIFLSRYPASDEISSYINAVQVDGFRSPERFIVTQQPLPNTLGDFWRLVEEYNISVILSLNEIDTTDETSCEFWPTEKVNRMNPVDYMSIDVANTRKLDCYDLTTVRMYLHGSKYYKTIEIISMNKWPAKNNLPSSVEEFLTYWEESDALCRRADKVLVTCYDGVKAAGVYVAASFIIEKMKLEQLCDVCLAVRTVRRHRPKFIDNEEQFQFLYEAAVKYIEGFQSYANFT